MLFNVVKIVAFLSLNFAASKLAATLVSFLSLFWGSWNGTEDNSFLAISESLSLSDKLRSSSFALAEVGTFLKAPS